MCTMKIIITRSRARYQQLLFEEPPGVPAVQLPVEVREELRQALTQWMQALTKTTRKGGGDEQNQR
jgi:hypothetical protein